MKINCLPIEVYKNGRFGDCTNNGISSRFSTLLLACPDGHITFDSDKELPLNFCMIERRRLFGNEEHQSIIPATVDETGKVVARPGWWMFGGNIASTSDSRFTRLKGHYYPLDIHDRQE